MTNILPKNIQRSNGDYHLTEHNEERKVEIIARYHSLIIRVDKVVDMRVLIELMVFQYVDAIYLLCIIYCSTYIIYESTLLSTFIMIRKEQVQK